MNEQWQQWQDKINALNQRERIILLVTVLVAVVMLFQVLLIDPVLADRKRASRELTAVKQAIQQDENARVVLSAELTAGVNRHKEQLREQLTEKVATLDNEIQQSVIALIPPQLMPEVLENILAENKELRLISLENKPVVPVLEDADETTKSATATSKGAGAEKVAEGATRQGLYRHGFVLTLSGNYMAAMRYLEQLSKLPWRFYWDDLRYQVERYPAATITLEVHTVSMSEDWIGV